MRKDIEVTTLIAIFTVQTKEMKSYRTNWLVIFLLTGLIYSNINTTIAQPAPDENFCVVSARLIYGDSVCIVGGHGPLEFYWDDGSWENMFVWIITGNMVAVKYKPPGYPLRCLGGRINVGDGSYPEGAEFLGTDMRILILDDDGPNNLPGTILDSITITIENYEWVTFGGLDAVIEEGEFYIGMEQLNLPPFAAPVGIDEENPTLFKSYTKLVGEEWQLSSYQDIMIRALTCGVDLNVRELVSEKSFWLELARITNFDPEIGENPEDGDLTIIDSLSYLWYEDTLFYTLDPGYYAFAIRIMQDSVATTGWYYTNTLSHQVVETEEINKNITDILIYPNPAIEEVKIESNDLILSVSIINAFGQKLFDQDFDEKEITIKTGFLKSGFYFIRLKTKNEALTRKILKL